MIKRTLLIHLIDQAVPRAARRISIHEGHSKPATSVPAALKVMGYRMRRLLSPHRERSRGYLNFNHRSAQRTTCAASCSARTRCTPRRATTCPPSTASGAAGAQFARGGRLRRRGQRSKTACCSAAYTSGAARVSRTASSCRTASIGEDAELENAILDKVVTVRARGERLIAPRQYPIVVGKSSNAVSCIAASILGGRRI